MERLAAGHIPVDFIEEIDRTVRRVIKEKKKLNRRMAHDARPVIAPNKHTNGMDADIGENSRHDSRASPVETTESLANRLNDKKGPCHSSALRESIPDTAFFVDPSRETFCSFLDLIKSVWVKQSTVNSVIGGKHAAAKPVDTWPQKGKCPHMRSPCSKSPLAQTERFIEHPKAQQNELPGRSKSIVAVSKIATVEVLPCTLRLLAVNLFHLVRDTAIRRAWRENGGGFERVTPTISRKKGVHTSGSEVLQTESRDEREPIEECIAVAEDENTCKLEEENTNCAKTRDPEEEVERDKKHTKEGVSVVQGAGTKSSRFQCKVPRELGTENMHGVIQELAQILRDIMEEASHQSARVSKGTSSLCRLARR